MPVAYPLPGLYTGFGDRGQPLTAAVRYRLADHRSQRARANRVGAGGIAQDCRVTVTQG